MQKTGIFYGPEKGSVSKVAKIIATELGEGNSELMPIKEASPAEIEKFEHIIFGISTLGRTNWDSDHDDNDWDQFFTQLSKINWEGKKVAIFGLGDHINYPDHFVDAIGWLKEKLKPYNVEIVGKCEAEEYQFNDSEALEGLFFAGLPIDEDNEAEKTLARVRNWLKKLSQEHTF